MAKTGFFRKLFGSGTLAKAIEDGGTPLKTDAESGLHLQTLAIQSAVGYIASAVSQCNLRTFQKHKEVEEKEYYLWNVAPNEDQNSTQFYFNLIEELIYNGECLIVEKNGRLFIADSFVEDDNNGFSPNIYTNISYKGASMPDKKSKDVLHLKMDNRAIKGLLSDVIYQYEQLILNAADGYKKFYGDKGILTIGSLRRGGTDTDEIKKNLVNGRFRDFFSATSAVLPLYEGYEYTPMVKASRTTSEMNDVKVLTDEIYNRVGQTFRIPPAMLKGEVADFSDSVNSFLTFAIKPICNIIEEEINKKRYGFDAYKDGTYVAFDVNSITMMNVFTNAAGIDKLIADGIYSIDDILKKAGEEPLNTEESQTHFITKNYAPVGGENV